MKDEPLRLEAKGDELAIDGTIEPSDELVEALARLLRAARDGTKEESGAE